jgi:hypothetical protein
MMHLHPGEVNKKPNSMGIPPTTVAQAYVYDAASVAAHVVPQGREGWLAGKGTC